MDSLALIRLAALRLTEFLRCRETDRILDADEEFILHKTKRIVQELKLLEAVLTALDAKREIVIKWQGSIYPDGHVPSKGRLS